MKLIFKTLFILFFINNSLGQTSKYNFTLDCFLKNDLEGYMFVEYEGKLDSCLIVNNNFSFEGLIDKDIVRAVFYLKDKPSNVFGVYLEKKQIKLELSVEDRLMNNGSKLSFFKLLSIHGTETAKIEDEYNEIWQKYLFDKTKDYRPNLYRKLDEIVVNHPKNPLGVDLLSSLTRQKDTDKNILKSIYVKIDKSIASESTIKFIEQDLYPENFIKIDDLVFDFELPDDKGKIFNTKDLKGKWYLLDFWASWCEPCRKQMPSLKKVYSLYKNRNFEILGISIDKNKSNWINALKKENVDWINVIENKEFLGEVVKKYHINSIPSNVLINNYGKVIAKNIDLDQLEVILKNIKVN
ncbi:MULTISPECIES: TlpA disulfide reductase family protein [Flavobacterium]|uniref:TlpA disulfide reductase family protein n=1 Tax=Flavobacterium hankyongi TaxID=1176532 RepID=A0ABP9A712_9FLAO|nr:TlpA disulfide reductase family protein [Flavobacterium sp. N1846]